MYLLLAHECLPKISTGVNQFFFLVHTSEDAPPNTFLSFRNRHLSDVCSLPLWGMIVIISSCLCVPSVHWHSVLFHSKYFHSDDHRWFIEASFLSLSLLSRFVLDHFRRHFLFRILPGGLTRETDVVTLSRERRGNEILIGKNRLEDYGNAVACT